MGESKIENTINLRNLIHEISKWKKFLFSKWKTIVLFGILGALLGFTFASFSKKKYIAELTFSLDEKTSSIGAYAGIASQFGFDLGKGEPGVFSGDNIVELFKSRLIIENTLLTPVTINGKTDLLVNRYIHFNKMNESWDKDIEENLKFVSNVPRNKFRIEQDSILFMVSNEIKKYALSVEKVDKKLSIIDMKCLSYDDQFAKNFTEIMVKNVTEFYIDTKTKKIKSNIALLQNRVDSVKEALDMEMLNAAVNQDQNQNPAKVQGRIPLMKRQMNIQLLTTMYGELLKNLELTKITLMREEPLIQIIDRPIYPLPYNKPGRLIFLILGGFLSGFLTISFLISRKIYDEVMAS